MENKTLENFRPIPRNSVEALGELKEGNTRFIKSLQRDRDSMATVKRKASNPQPFATILACMDSRTSPELIFDQGIGDIFCVRVGGNIVDAAIIGSLELTVATSSSKAIVVLGHTACAAIQSACNHVELGNTLAVTASIQKAILQETVTTSNRTDSNPDFLANIAWINAKQSVNQILKQSTVIRELVEANQIQVVPALYDVATGQVSFTGWK
jgi:carbonic anhydrase